MFFSSKQDMDLKIQNTSFIKTLKKLPQDGHMYDSDLKIDGDLCRI